MTVEPLVDLQRFADLAARLSALDVHGITPEVVAGWTARERLEAGAWAMGVDRERRRRAEERHCGKEFFCSGGEYHSPMVCGSNRMGGGIIQCDDCKPDEWQGVPPMPECLAGLEPGVIYTRLPWPEPRPLDQPPPDGADFRDVVADVEAEARIMRALNESLVPPLVAGGQGRTGDQVVEEVNAWLAQLPLLIAAAAAFALGWLLGGVS